MDKAATLMMKTICSFIILVSFYQITWHHVTEHNLQLQFHTYVINQGLYSAGVLSFQKDLKDSMQYQNPQKGVTSASQIWGTIPVKIKTQRKPYRY